MDLLNSTWWVAVQNSNLKTLYSNTDSSMPNFFPIMIQKKKNTLVDIAKKTCIPKNSPLGFHLLPYL